MIITDADSTPILSISFLHILAGDKLSHKIFLILTFKTHYKQKDTLNLLSKDKRRVLSE